MLVEVREIQNDLQKINLTLQSAAELAVYSHQG
jgi:hypothetical protein